MPETNRPAMTMRQIREALGHTNPPVLVEATRYTISLFPRDDMNFNAFAIYVQRRRDGWGITDGAGWVESVNGDWTLDHYNALSIAELNDALAMARKMAPHIVVNGRTAVDVYRRTRPAV